MKMKSRCKQKIGKGCINKNFMGFILCIYIPLKDYKRGIFCKKRPSSLEVHGFKKCRIFAA